MLGKKTFKGGIHPSYHKELTREKPIKKLNAPAEVIIPVIQHAGTPCDAVVKVGDEVRIGTKIADSEKFISAPIHSSVSGKVKAVKKYSHPVLGKCESIIIASDGKDEIACAAKADQENLEGLNPDKIREIIRETGIVGLGGAAFPTHVKLTPPSSKLAETFILNGAECEPYLTCDERVMIERSEKVLKGALLMMKTLGATKGIVAIEDNKPEAIEAMSVALGHLKPKDYNLRLEVLPTKYPQGSEKQLIKALLKREVPAGGLPIDLQCVVDNVHTALAVYEAVQENKPLYERVITVTGDAIAKPANLLVRIGTPISYIIDECGGLSQKAAKIIVGGPMMGLAQYTSETPVTKGSSGVLMLSSNATAVKDPTDCIRCARCIEVCPVGLMPMSIAKAAEYDHFDMANELNAVDCMECGCCAYGCPSNIQLVQLIKHAKRGILCQI